MTPEIVDNHVAARLPDAVTDPVYFEHVVRHMVHGTILARSLICTSSVAPHVTSHVMSHVTSLGPTSHVTQWLSLTLWHVSSYFAGPCGTLNPKHYCMKSDHTCKFDYPKRLQDRTTIPRDGYAVLMRPAGPSVVMSTTFTADNRCSTHCARKSACNMHATV